MTASEEDMSQLTAMGFSTDQSREALMVSNGSVELAVNYLLGGGGGGTSSNGATGASSSNATASNTSLVTCPISQYSVENGRSACTCIALTAATIFLATPSPSSDSLQDMIHQGVQKYQQLSTAGASSGVEHLSAEEVLQKDPEGAMFGLESTGSGIVQGILNNDVHHPLGLKALLGGIRQQQTPNSWTCILMTKTPETILICFPPPSSSQQPFWLIDSHPRSQLGTESAYAQSHPGLDSLIASLRIIFPCTDLGSDVPEMMAMMYNSFDLYPLTKRGGV